MNKVIFESASRSAATHNSAAFTAQGFVGAKIFVDVSVHNGGTVTVKLQAMDQISGNWVDITGATTAALSGSNQTVVLNVHPALTASANVAVSQLMGNTCRAVATVATAAVTFSVSVDLVR